MNTKHFAGALIATAALAGCDFGGGADTDAGVDSSLPLPDANPSKVLACKTGTLLAGSPRYDGAPDSPASGSPLKGDPPLLWRGLSFDGNLVYTNTGEEVWYTDLSAPQPVQKRVTGAKGDAQSKDGACADARLTATFGQAVLPDHSLVVADVQGNRLVKITDPTGPACKVSHLAGVGKRAADNMNDQDGPGKSAKISGPLWPVAAADGTIYFVDWDNKKVKKIAPGADAVVSTVASLKGSAIDDANSMVLRGDKLYLADNDFSNGIIVEINPADGKVTTIFKGGGSAFDVEGAPVVMGLATDGTRLFVSAKDQIFTINPDNTATLAAGAPREFEFPRNYDPTADHPAEELVLLTSIGRSTTAGANAFLTYQGDSLYYTGGVGNGIYVEKITCPK